MKMIKGGRRKTWFNLDVPIQQPASLLPRSVALLLGGAAWAPSKASASTRNKLCVGFT